MIEQKIKDEIDEMPYIEMLRLWRFGSSDSKYFQGETGEYFSKVMNDKKSKLKDGEHTQASKSIGW